MNYELNLSFEPADLDLLAHLGQYVAIAKVVGDGGMPDVCLGEF